MSEREKSVDDMMGEEPYSEEIEEKSEVEKKNSSEADDSASGRGLDAIK
jgi:hypothetical protein